MQTDDVQKRAAPRREPFKPEGWREHEEATHTSRRAPKKLDAVEPMLPRN